MLTRDSSQSGRRRGAAPVDRRNRPTGRPVRTLRDRADAAIISQWLTEQVATPARTPKAPAAAPV